MVGPFGAQLAEDAELHRRGGRIDPAHPDLQVNTGIAQTLDIGGEIPRDMTQVSATVAQDSHSQRVMWIVGFRLQNDRIARAQKQRLILGRFRPEPQTAHEEGRLEAAVRRALGSGNDLKRVSLALAAAASQQDEWILLATKVEGLNEVAIVGAARRRQTIREQRKELEDFRDSIVGDSARGGLRLAGPELLHAVRTLKRAAEGGIFSRPRLGTTPALSQEMYCMRRRIQV